MWFKNTKLQTRFLIAPVFIFLSLAALTSLFYVTIVNQFDYLDYATKDDFQELQLLYRSYENVSYIHNEINILAAQSSETRSPQHLTEFGKYARKKIEECEGHWESLIPDLPLSSEGFKKASQALQQLGKYKEMTAGVLNGLASGGNQKQKMVELNASYESFTNQAHHLMNRANLKTKKTITHYQDNTRDLFKYFAVVICFFIGVALTFSYWLARNLSKPLREMLKTIHQISGKGDFSLRVEKTVGGEIGVLVDGFNHMLFEISRIEDIFKKNSDQFKDILENIGMMIAITDEKGLIKFVSKSLLDHLMRSRAQIVNHHVGDFFYIVDHGAPQPLDVDRFKTKKHQTIKEVFVVDANQKVSAIRLATSLIENKKLGTTGIVMVAASISKDKVVSISQEFSLGKIVV